MQKMLNGQFQKRVVTNGLSEVKIMHSIVFICPYFGKLPKGQFPLWLKSCEMNPTINWIIFTNDTTNYNYPINVKVNYTTLKKFMSIFENKIDAKLNIEHPHKLCDLRPTYGYVFQDYIKDYDYWGYTDISDTIYGNLRKFLTTSNLESADKIMYLGHFSLYKNTEDVNLRFYEKSKNSMSLDNIFGIGYTQSFDEFAKFGINYIFMDNGYPIKIIDNFYEDIAPFSSNFEITKLEENINFYIPHEVAKIFQWDNGSLYCYEEQNNSIIKKEIAYVHFQKRKMRNLVKSDCNNFLIVPNKFITTPKTIDINIMEKYTRKIIFNSPYISYKQKKNKRILQHRLNKLFSIIKKFLKI